MEVLDGGPLEASFGAVLRVDATNACCRISCNFCRLAEEPLEGGVSAPPVPSAADFCPLGVSVICESCPNNCLVGG